VNERKEEKIAEVREEEQRRPGRRDGRGCHWKPIEIVVRKFRSLWTQL